MGKDVFSQDAILSLRAELQSVTQSERAIYERISEDAGVAILHFVEVVMGIQLSQQKRAIVLDLARRLTIVDSLQGLLPESDKDRAVIMGYADLKARSLVVVAPHAFWTKYYDNFPYLPPKEEMITKFGDKVEAAMFVLAFCTTLSHEVFHLLQHPALPSVFCECGVRWYQYQAFGKTGNLALQEDDVRRINFYQSLVDKFGDRVHLLFFNKSNNILHRVQILRAARKFQDRYY
jgi:hypothetical protein